MYDYGSDYVSLLLAQVSFVSIIHERDKMYVSYLITPLAVSLFCFVVTFTQNTNIISKARSIQRSVILMNNNMSQTNQLWQEHVVCSIFLFCVALSLRAVRKHLNPPKNVQDSLFF